MPRLLRLFFRFGGWLMTPVVTILAAALGATIGAMVAPRLSPLTGVIVALASGIVAAALGLWLWSRLLRRSPELRDVLQVTEEGVPTERAMDEIIGSDPPPTAPAA